jgi:hypothetical protein
MPGAPSINNTTPASVQWVNCRVSSATSLAPRISQPEWTWPARGRPEGKPGNRTSLGVGCQSDQIKRNRPQMSSVRVELLRKILNGAQGHVSYAEAVKEMTTFDAPLQRRPTP